MGGLSATFAAGGTRSAGSKVAALQCAAVQAVHGVHDMVCEC